jgi:hypothetical protein
MLLYIKNVFLFSRIKTQLFFHKKKKDKSFIILMRSNPIIRAYHIVLVSVTNLFQVIIIDKASLASVVNESM